jgi:hypothetical protein
VANSACQLWTRILAYDDQLPEPATSSLSKSPREAALQVLYLNDIELLTANRFQHLRDSEVVLVIQHN